jgi:hypothetical protein
MLVHGIRSVHRRERGPRDSDDLPQSLLYPVDSILERRSGGIASSERYYR